MVETEMIWMFSVMNNGVLDKARLKYAKRTLPKAGIVVAIVMAICLARHGGIWWSRMAFWQSFPPKYATIAVMNHGRNR